jgi:hypothetical protein
MWRTILFPSVGGPAGAKTFLLLCDSIFAESTAIPLTHASSNKLFLSSAGSTASDSKAGDARTKSLIPRVV